MGMTDSTCKHLGAHAGLYRAGAVILVILLLSLTDGCTRRFFREATDKEVNDILAEKDRCGPWQINSWHVYPDPRARFADTTTPDRPPMPPDEEWTDRLSPHPQQP